MASNYRAESTQLIAESARPSRVRSFNYSAAHFLFQFFKLFHPDFYPVFFVSRIRLRLRFARASAVGAGLFLSASSAVAQAPQLEIWALGFLPEGNASQSNAVSATGNAAVGWSNPTNGSNTRNAVIWRYGGTNWGSAIDLHTVTGATDSEAFAISSNSNIVAGYYINSGVGTAAIWNYSGSAWSVTALDPLQTGYDSRALALSASGNVAVGCSGSGALGVGGCGNVNTMQAVVWRYASGVWGIDNLHTYIGGGGSSRAMAVSADGDVIAGFGNPTGDGTNKGYVWRYSGGSYTMTFLTASASAAVTAISANGNVIGGNTNPSSVLPTIWSYNAGTWGAGVTLAIPSNPSDPAYIPDFNGLANGSVMALSGDGRVAVGFVTNWSSFRAFYYTAADGMKSLAQVLTDAGVNLTGWVLENATGITADGSIITGYGKHNSITEAWIMTFGGWPALITPSEIARSYASLGALGRTGNAALGTTLSTMSQYATQGMENPSCAVNGRNAQQDCPRFSVFAVAGYDSDPSGFGKLGMTMRLDEEGTIAGALIGADYIRTDMYADGEATMRGGSAGLFVARTPEAGLQWLVGLSGLTISGDVDRGYHNGNTPTTSRGNTTGNGYGIEARAGWTFDQLVSKTKITPFASYTFSSIRYDGYTESGGPFPASFAAFTDEMQTTRLGMDARYTLAPGNWVWGTLAWGHRFKGDGPEISGQLIGGLFGMSVPGLTTDADWLEATAGLRMPVSTSAAFTTSASVTVPEHQQESYVFRAGLSQAF